MSIRHLERLGLLAAGAATAGVHAGLAPEHLREWPPLGGAFVAAAVAVSAAVGLLAVGAAGGRPVQALALLLAGVIAAYVATRIVALPPLDPEREPLDPIGVAATAVEAAGLLLALHLSRQRGGTP